MARCEICGKIFYSKSILKKYCSRECRLTASKIRQKANEQLCWSCENACGGCSWSSCLKPVKGWEATPVVVKDSEGDIYTYKITGCPQYKFEDIGGYYGEIY